MSLLPRPPSALRRKTSPPGQGLSSPAPLPPPRTSSSRGFLLFSAPPRPRTRPSPSSSPSLLPGAAAAPPASADAPPHSLLLETSSSSPAPVLLAPSAPWRRPQEARRPGGEAAAASAPAGLRPEPRATSGSSAPPARAALALDSLPLPSASRRPSTHPRRLASTSMAASPSVPSSRAGIEASISLRSSAFRSSAAPCKGRAVAAAAARAAAGVHWAPPPPSPQRRLAPRHGARLFHTVLATMLRSISPESALPSTKYGAFTADSSSKWTAVRPRFGRGASPRRGPGTTQPPWVDALRAGRLLVHANSTNQ